MRQDQVKAKVRHDAQCPAIFADRDDRDCTCGAVAGARNAERDFTVKQCFMDDKHWRVFWPKTGRVACFNKSEHPIVQNLIAYLQANIGLV